MAKTKRKKFDPVAWQNQIDTLLEELPDEGLAKEIRAGVTGRIRRKLQTPTGAPFKLMTGEDILNTQWPEPTWAIPNLLPVGLAILAGRPKIGKSWMALQIAQSVASGGKALGEDVQQGAAFYLALEDTPRRLKDRMLIQGWNATHAKALDVMYRQQFVDEVGDLKKGGGDLLAQQIKERQYRLVVIDTLSKSVAGDQADVVAMTEALAPLHTIANDLNSVVLLLHHHRKGTGGEFDAISDILGSTAIAAVPDTHWGLYKEQGKAGAKLKIVGRDLDEKTLALEMDWLSGAWQVETSPTGQALTGMQADILDALNSIAPAGVTAIAAAMGKDKGNIYRVLSDMVNLGILTKTGKGRGSVLYDIP